MHLTIYLMTECVLSPAVILLRYQSHGIRCNYEKQLVEESPAKSPFLIILGDLWQRRGPAFSPNTTTPPPTGRPCNESPETPEGPETFEDRVTPLWTSKQPDPKTTTPMIPPHTIA